MKKKQLSALLIVFIFGGSFLAYAINYSIPTPNHEKRGRALIQVVTCGEQRKIPTLQKRIGNSTFTSNTTGLITFPPDKKITLGKALDLMNISFSERRLMEYQNGNECDNPYSNEVSVWVGDNFQNLKKIDRYRDYAIKNGDVISVRYS